MVRLQPRLLFDGFEESIFLDSICLLYDVAKLLKMADNFEHLANHKAFSGQLRLIAKHKEWLDENAPGWTIYEEFLGNSSYKMRMIEFPNDEIAILYKLTF